MFQNIPHLFGFSTLFEGGWEVQQVGGVGDLHIALWDSANICYSEYAEPVIPSLT